MPRRTYVEPKYGTNNTMDRQMYCAFNVRKIPKKLKNEFASLCDRTGHTMEDTIVALLEKYSKSPEKFKIHPTPGTREITREPSFIFLRNLPRALKAKFKSVCMLREDTIEDVLFSLMTAFVKTPDMFTVKRKGKKRPWEIPYREYR